MSGLAQMDLDVLMRRPRGARMVLGVALRVILAAVLLALCCWAVVSCAEGFSEPYGKLRVSHCESQWFLQSNQNPECSGTLTTASGGHVVSTSARLYGRKLTAGETIAVRYDGHGSDLDPRTSSASWLGARDGLISITLGLGAVMASLSAWRRVRPDLAWFRPGTKQWETTTGISTAVGVLAAVASLVCAVVGFL